MKMPTGSEMIKAERRRQITKEKWTAKHDEKHDDASLSSAALCYERCARFQEECGQFAPALTAAFDLEPKNWPWDAHWFKLGRTAIRTLTKAGALYQAEVDRLNRLSKRGRDISLCSGCLNNAKKGVERCAAAIDRLLR